MEKDNEKTNLVEEVEDTLNGVQTTQTEEPKSNDLKSSAMGAGSGILIGGMIPVMMGMKVPENIEEEQTEEETPIAEDEKEEGEPTDNHREALSNPEVVDDKVMVATGVNDGMSFSQAFAQARAEVGPGGVFEWHGNLYGTYYQTEWNQMTAAEKAEYNEHFAWHKLDSSHSDIVNHDLAQNSEIEVIGVESSEPEVKVLGVVQDPESGMIYGGIYVDGQEAVLVDVDGDLVFEAIVSDLDGNGQITQNEIGDISGMGISVPDLTGESIADNNQFTNDDNVADADNLYFT